MPDKEIATKRKRMVVEEVKPEEAPKKEERKEEQPKPDILETGEKVSSEELTKGEKEGMVEEKPIERETQEIVPESPKRKKSISPAFWIVIPGIFLLGAILGGIVFYQRGINKGQQEANPTPTPVESSSPTASPSASIDLTKYTVDILNGSGIAGEAGRAKTLLTSAGFKVGTTTNAATYDYTKTIIKAKSTVDADFVSALSSALGKNYVVDTAQTLSATSTDDIQIIIGSSKVTSQ